MTFMFKSVYVNLKETWGTLTFKAETMRNLCILTTHRPHELSRYIGISEFSNIS